MDNNKKNKDGDLPTILICIFLFSSLMTPIFVNQYQMNEPVVEEEVIEAVNEEEEIEVSEDLFEAVYNQDATYKIVRFIPTDVLYVSHNRGDLVPMTDAYGNLLTYQEYKRLTEK